MSKMIWLVGLGVLAGAAVMFLLLRDRLGGSDLPEPLARWQAHLAAAGIEARGNLVRAGARGSQLRFNGHFKVKGATQPMFLQWYDSHDSALAQLAVVQRYPEGAAALVRGELLLDLPGWPLADAMTQQVRTAFQSFDVPQAR